MSNVLIGIIGVILFIGLALAGALFLGPRFQESTQNSQAASIMSSLKQATDAAELRMLDLGVQYTPATDASFLTTGGYLKTVPTNAAPSARGSSSYDHRIVFNNNIYADGADEPQNAARFAMTVIGPEDDAVARGICAAISRTYGEATVPTTTDNFPDHSRTSGCMAANGHNAKRWYIAYSRIRNNTGSNDIPSGWSAGQR
jgi:hypothetical protein